MESLHLNGPYAVSQSLYLTSLTLEEDAQLLPPEGKLLTMTVNGVQIDPAPGVYTGSVALTVTDPLGVPAPKGSGTPGGPGSTPEEFRAVILGGMDGIVLEQSVLSAYTGGTIDGTSICGGVITTTGEAMNGLLIEDGSYNVRDLTIRNTGHSPNDFNGLGASVLVGNAAEAVFENLSIENQGIRNDGIVTLGTSRITVRNSDIHVRGGTPEQIQSVEKRRPGKSCMTYVSGGWGTTRAINVEHDSSAVFENCRIRSENWGVLSTDGISSPKEWRPVKTRIYAKDCDVTITGRHGYGAYSIGDCKNVFDHTKMYSPDVAFKVANELAGGEIINGSEIIGGRFGVMFQSNQGGLVKIKDSTVRSGRSTFIARSCFPQIECENAVLTPGNRVILQMFDSDDPGFGRSEIEVDTEVPVKDPAHDVTQPNYHTLSIWGFPQEHWCTDLQASFKDMTIIGDFYNGITNAAKPKMMPQTPPPSENKDKQPGSPPAPVGMPPMETKSYPINLVLTLDHVELEGVISASRTHHASKTISGENRKEIYQVYDSPCPVVNNGVIVTLKNGTIWTVVGKSYLSALHIDSTSEIRTPDGCAVKLVVNGQEVPYTPGDYTGDILVSAYQIATPAMF